MENRQSEQSESGRFTRRETKAYQAAMEAAFSIPIAGGLGYWADASFETSPFGLLIGLGLGFVTCVLRLLRMRGVVEQAQEEAEAEAAERFGRNPRDP